MSQTNRALVFLSFARPSGLRDWVRDHDERWSFVVLYLGLAVGLSVFVSLFWLLVVGALHFALECGRQAHFREGGVEIVGHAMWEVKLDVGLVLLALTLVLYIDVVLGLLGLQSAARAAAVTRVGARVGSRAAAWERTIRTFLITVDEMARIAYAAVLMRKGGSGAVQRGAADEARAEAREAAAAGRGRGNRCEPGGDGPRCGMARAVGDGGPDRSRPGRRGHRAHAGGAALDASRLGYGGDRADGRAETLPVLKQAGSGRATCPPGRAGANMQAQGVHVGWCRPRPSKPVRRSHGPPGGFDSHALPSLPLRLTTRPVGGYEPASVCVSAVRPAR
jgi:hypothetical protein